MIYIECDADEVLLIVLGFSRRQFIHQAGKYEICKTLLKTKNSIGLIEHDSGLSDPIYRKKCLFLESRHDINTYLHKDSGNKLVVLYNTLEDWTIKVARNNKVNVKDFGLESDSDRMHRLMPGRLQNYKQLISELLRKQIHETDYLQAKLSGE